ncbi:hypothetical protein EZS27_043960, partial [termite gut metagenome]
MPLNRRLFFPLFLTQATANYEIYLCEINGGNLHNAIPREACAVCALPNEAKHA